MGANSMPFDMACKGSGWGVNTPFPMRGETEAVGDSPEVRLPLYPRKQTQVGPHAMSVLCHKQTHASQQNVFLFDHLVGGGKQRWRNSQAERFCRLQVDDELELCGLHHR
jgi:hypothetical protein